MKRNISEFVERHKKDRQEYAVRLRSMRAMLITTSTKLDRASLNGMAKRMVGMQKPMKPTIQNFIDAAKEAEKYAMTKFDPIVLSDGYALCGEEDARADRQYHAGIYAKQCRAAMQYIALGVDIEVEDGYGD